MDKGKLGVIGGMGPQATLQFCQRVIDLTAAHSDQEHIPTLIVSDTEMPDRTAALLSGDAAPVRSVSCPMRSCWRAGGPPPLPSPATRPTPSSPPLRGS